jgi:hypothetical protein
MNTENFIKNIEHICSVVGLSLPIIVQKKEKLPFTLSTIKNISYQYDDKNIVNIKEISNDYIVFNLYLSSKLDLYIKTEDINNENISVYYFHEDNIRIFSESLSIVLLINISLWMYDKKAVYKTSFKEKTSEFYFFIKDNYSFICSDRPSINQLFFSANSFMIFMFGATEYFIAAIDEASLSSLQQQINVIKDKDKNKKIVGEKINYDSDFIMNAKIIKNKNILVGKIIIEKKIIDIEIDPENAEVSNEIFNEYVVSLKKMLEFYHLNSNILFSKIASDVINDFYQQSDYKPNEKDYNKFEKRMKLKKINVFPNGFIVVYNIKTDRGERMYVQLNESFSIEEITIG